MAATLTALSEFERLSPAVIRILGGNPGKFTLQGTNTYLVGKGPKRLLIDTGQGMPAWLASLKKVLKEENASVEHAILTHWHPDHVKGVPDLLSFSPATKVYKNQPDEGTQLDIADGQRFETDGATLRAFHCPGHTTDHMAFILEEEDAMFTGDNVLGSGTAVFEDLATYMNSLGRMAQQFAGRAYPGHGPVIEDGKAKVQQYIKHRQEREAQVLEVLARSNGHLSSWKSMQIVKDIYKDVPETLHEAAQRGVLQVLGKLTTEGRVAHDPSLETWSLAGKSAL
ncbi:metallo-beta-lactamase superfamily protein [Diplodia corticola]|uniref:Metallo-beta-lactamase superfamily protein n=1 Tax=Diplodia corticola TaxID=236234 RepID=A0A1J9R4R6_9PEZI|nr:metallo-beta-lactamase superfamily protein [Diplodia corticola]OJD35592.1 metallo-beta-lactamase superfamily protein [Diplodia corticola]